LLAAARIRHTHHATETRLRRKLAHVADSGVAPLTRIQTTRYIAPTVAGNLYCLRGGRRRIRDEINHLAADKQQLHERRTRSSLLTTVLLAYCGWIWLRELAHEQ